MSLLWFALLALAVAAERLVELLVSARHLRWARDRGGVEYGGGHYPAMVAVHAALLVGMVAEVALAGRPFLPPLGWTALAFVVASQALRWWCVQSLGSRWNTRVVVVPGLPLVERGPYRWLRHPNYLAVVAEGVALPLVHTAWLSALLFLAANSLVLAVRLRVENAALGFAP
ncbi:isoprenylcysteine carboxyl methyltransferase family protein [Streptomyces xiaopingdaonensis]|uniref:isoprenylcysteine carboxyl methyltransferase family protein n=1 Tax=Streptomyces xiaopingdaonensis TaxID=1565415 RepID=UPI0002F1C88F|nr:isoprenylcysteine carboxylmethyltransferase family protein [Streptomyces xiaopingdaonensis]